ncbi:hypothetical protein [Kurthia sibirica]|uniref:Uncharacterized protein n=1 Tax=Kurthia sibirica TaxID=202750 RepID=A0A2U3ALY5_9BACL|nr:hypothetical protein [Kurthia sibirica]PWI25542.1 hypothetical protein DEX24_08010 [Kurthia sibirica]GEK33919.1 hypothetical protein KSI01_14520 [Kurthia sibirica]
MNTIAGTISLSVSFVLFIYLSGLKVTYSTKYISEFWVFPILLLLLSIILFGLEFKKTRKSL